MNETTHIVHVSSPNQCLSLHFRLHSAIQAKQKDKQTISQLEKRLKAEQDARALAEKQLVEERKRKKMEEATAARAVALAAATRFTFYYRGKKNRLTFIFLFFWGKIICEYQRSS